MNDKGSSIYTEIYFKRINSLVIWILLYGYNNTGCTGCTVCILNTANIIGTYISGESLITASVFSYVNMRWRGLSIYTRFLLSI